MLRPLACALASLASLAHISTAYADTRTVGPGKTFTAPCAAFAAASDGDTIEIDAAGSYKGDVCTIQKNKLTIRGVGGRAHIQADGKNAGGKAIWVISGADTVLEDIELSGCTVPDKNGAGIRQEGRNLTVRRGFFHDNENGILGNADAESVYLIEDSEFANNGAGDGYSHNMYIGEIKSFTLRGSYSHDAKVGHLVKSRALSNHILYNRLSDEAGNASYQLDLPQGGPSFVIGNVLQKSARAENASLLSYAREGKRNPDSSLWVVGNTFFNGRSAGTFVSVASDLGSVHLRNNIFAGPGTVCDLTSATSESNLVGDAHFVASASYDFHLLSDSPAIDHAIAAGSAAGEPLTPICQYAHPAHSVQRNVVGALDQGAFELGVESTSACGVNAPPSISSDAGIDAASPAPAAPRADAATSAEGGHGAGSFDAGTTQGEPTSSSSGGCDLRSAVSSSRSTWSVLVALLLAAIMLRRRVG